MFCDVQARRGILSLDGQPRAAYNCRIFLYLHYAASLGDQQ